MMAFDPQVHHRRSVRLRGHDYSDPGMYYVTICTRGKRHLFGQVLDGEMHRNELGDSVARFWQWLGRQYPYVNLDEWVVMPNHLHGIIIVTERVGGSQPAPPEGARRRGEIDTEWGRSRSRGVSRTAPTKHKSLGRLVGAFKTVSTGRINELRGTPGCPLWQRNYYEHIIRSEDELNKIREYVRTNPLRWGSEPEGTW